MCSKPKASLEQLSSMPPTCRHFGHFGVLGATTLTRLPLSEVTTTFYWYPTTPPKRHLQNNKTFPQFCWFAYFRACADWRFQVTKPSHTAAPKFSVNALAVCRKTKLTLYTRRTPLGARFDAVGFFTKTERHNAPLRGY